MVVILYSWVEGLKTVFQEKGDLELNLTEEEKHRNVTEILFVNTMPLLPEDV